MASTESEMIAKIRELFRQKGDSMYGGEAVTQLEHALEGATMAESEGASPETITAALLHDVGHLLHNFSDDAPRKGVDDAHEQLGYRWLKKEFPPEVTEPIRLHVDAKRYLCTTDSAYQETLSAPSLRSLQLQGGTLSPEEAATLEKHPFFNQIIHVRRLDDRAKVVGMVTPDIEHFLGYVEQCLHSLDESEGRAQEKH